MNSSSHSLPLKSYRPPSYIYNRNRILCRSHFNIVKQRKKGSSLQQSRVVCVDASLRLTKNYSELNLSFGSRLQVTQKQVDARTAFAYSLSWAIQRIIIGRLRVPRRCDVLELQSVSFDKTTRIQFVCD